MSLLSDYPTGSKAIDRPTFSMCGGADSEDFLLPTYDMMMAVRIYTPQNSTVFLF